jgi:hypothetical protein
MYGERLLPYSPNVVEKGRSGKFASRILHRSSFEGRERGLFGPYRHARGDYMLWWCIKIRGNE